jgi:hypothetical protein
MRENNSNTCGIGRLNIMSIGTRLTFFEKTLEKYKHLQEGLDQMNEENI